jgi:hypothetical protein
MSMLNRERRFSSLVRAIPSVFAIAIAAACSDTSPTRPALRPAAPDASATESWTRVTFFNSHTFFVPCLAENVRFYGLVSYQYHAVENSAGGFDYHLQYRPETPNDPPFVAEGQSSGKVFYFQNGHPINISFHAAAGQVMTFIDQREIYIASDGSQLHLLSGLHVTVNANGELTVDRTMPFSVECSAG